MASQTGSEGLLDFWVKLKNNSQMMHEFTNKITINVSEFFRNPDKYDELKKVVLPQLLQGFQPISIWSAGCSHGAEPYSLGILLNKLSPARKHKIWATDIDEGILTRARQGLFNREEIANVTEEDRDKYFTLVGPNSFKISAKVQNQVEFSKHDLLRDEYPNQVDLILCRNVVIYFGDSARNHVHSGFYKALRPGGYLFIGSSERVVQSEAVGFVQRSPFIYQKPY
jgi:chemotaxis protein methyltransferase CheR